MRKLKLLSAVLLAAATFTTPVLAASHTPRHLVPENRSRVATPEQAFDGACIRAPRVGAFATQPWTYAAPCEPYSGYAGYAGYEPYTGYY
jgi:hypothetical protein